MERVRTGHTGICVFLTDQFGRQRTGLISRVGTLHSAEISQLAAKLTKKHTITNDNICLQGTSLSARPLRQALGHMQIMTKFLQFLRKIIFEKREEALTSNRDVILWWRKHRWNFNVIVFVTGVLSFIFMVLSTIVSEIFLPGSIEIPDMFIFSIIIVPVLYIVMANILYTSGVILELIMRLLIREKLDSFATFTYSFGLIFSIILTVAPGILLSISTIVNVVGGKLS